MTYLYTILNGDTVRIPFCLVTRRIDWECAEPWTEPPLLVRDDRRQQRKHYPVNVRLEQIRFAMLKMDRPTQKQIGNAIGLSYSRVRYILMESDRARRGPGGQFDWVRRR